MGQKRLINKYLSILFSVCFYHSGCSPDSISDPAVYTDGISASVLRRAAKYSGSHSYVQRHKEGTSTTHVKRNLENATSLFRHDE